jgi:hypothetical protein
MTPGLALRHFSQGDPAALSRRLATTAGASDLGNRRNTSTCLRIGESRISPTMLARAMQTGGGMQLRSRPDAFIRSMVDAATVRPFWVALRDLKRARVHTARQASGGPESIPTPPLTAISKAA